MPLTSEQRKLYPKDWERIRERIFVKAGYKCSFCGSEYLKPNRITGSRVILQCIHLDHDPTNNKDENLKSSCQRCHNIYDAKKRHENIKRKKSKKKELLYNSVTERFPFISKVARKFGTKKISNPRPIG